MQVLAYMMAAVVIGALLALQAPMNAILAKHVHSAIGATALQIFIAFSIAALLVWPTGGADYSAKTLAAVPWWVWLTGFIGVLFVAGGIVVVPVTGTFLFFACVVAGQLMGSMIADHLGAFGLPVREITPQRLLGLALLMGGAIMVYRG